ncbi:MAG: hypothetical protein PHV68_02210 [Candidatus Gastranaerophilales bacterium]|nr:hypothetical protein [Candidatus Gastranaerophilales bacterium]
MSYSMDELGFSKSIEPKTDIILPFAKEEKTAQDEEKTTEEPITTQTETFEKSFYLSEITDKFYVLQDFQEEATLIDQKEQDILQTKEELTSVQKDIESASTEEEKEEILSDYLQKYEGEYIESTDKEQTVSSRISEMIQKISEEQTNTILEKNDIIKKVSHLIEIDIQPEDEEEIKNEIETTKNQITEEPEENVKAQIKNLDSNLILALMCVTTGFN